MHTAQEVPPQLSNTYDLLADLARFTTSTVLRGDLDHYAAEYAKEEADWCTYLNITNAFDGAQAVATHYRQPDVQPRHLLTATAIRAAQTNHPGFAENGETICLASELKVEHSIQLAEACRKPRRHNIPAAVLFDRKDKPFAYMKSVGLRLGFSWREAEIVTSEGEQVVPAGAFFRAGWGYDGLMDMQKAARDSGITSPLLSLEHAGTPTKVRLIRFSAFLLSTELARTAYAYETMPIDSEGEVNGYHYLGEHTEKVLELGLDGISNQVLSLLDQGNAHQLRRSDIRL